MKTVIQLLIFCFPIFLSAQTNKLTIKGHVMDTTNDVLIGATVMLLDSKDSSLLSYARTDLNGDFIIKNVKRQEYLLKITYVGYIPYLNLISSQSPDLIDLKDIRLKEISKELMEVVIKAAKAPMTIRGDTIEYDASTFKVPAGSSVEDLLKRLPGIEVDQDGSIKAEGRSVTKVTVDGKRFFGTDPKAATKNLPAEGISKVQVFNTESEEKKLTGFDSKAPDKTMNLQLKDEFKKGGFGKIVAGIGTQNTKELKGNFNRFNEKEQISLLGMGNNTGRNGLSWNDYQDFRGSESSNWDDGGDFGFSNGGRRYIFFSDDDEDGGGLMSSFWGNNNYGFPENYTGGLNYNYDHKKNKFSGMYYYDQKGLVTESNSISKTFLKDEIVNNNSSNLGNKVNRNHKLDLRFEKEIDSLNTFIANLNGSIANRNNVFNGWSDNERIIGSSNTSRFDNLQIRENLLLRGNTIFRKKFKKKGRSLGLSASYFSSASNSDFYQKSDIVFYKIKGTVDSSQTINQSIASKSSKQQLNANAMYTEPLSKKIFWTTFYNFQNSNETIDRNVFDIKQNEPVNNDSLTRNFDNKILINRLGSYLRYAYKGVNVSVGVAYQLFNIKSDFKAGPSANIFGNVNRSYNSLLPNFNVSLDLKGKYLDFGYSADAKEPSLRNLQPIIDNSNPLYINIGNPNLIPEINHEINVGFNSFNPATFINFGLYSGFTISENQFVTSQIVDNNFITTSKTINLSGGQFLYSGINFGFPIIKNKFTINMNYSPGYGKSQAIVNDIKNITNTIRNRISLRVNLTPKEQFSCYLNSSLSMNDTKYNINTSQNQRIIEQSYSLELNAKLFWGIYSNNSFKYSINQNNRFNFYQEIPILNMSLSKLFLKENRGEIRISIYDVFNKTLGINQFANVNSVSSNINQSLARYAMLSFTYNIKGIKATTKSSNNWWN